ncbi:MAG TPA: hypothetical protein VI756_29140, partial [Blastocatellia bacterium]
MFARVMARVEDNKKSSVNSETITQRNDRRAIASQFCLVLALMILGSLTLNLVLCVTGFFVGKTVSVLEPCLAISLSLIAALLLIRRCWNWPPKRVALLGLVYILSLAVPIALAPRFHDVSCDGQTYQGSAVAKLAAGWNPIRDPENIDPVPYNSTLINILRFPKAHWIGESAIVKLTGNLESGKGLNLILAAVSF